MTSPTTKKPGKKPAKKPAKDPSSLSGPDRHLALRFSYGLTPELRRDVRRLGGRGWFEHQLEPRKISDRKADDLAGWWPSLGRSPLDLWQRTQSEVEPGWQVMEDYARWVLMRRITSKRQLLEVMAEFWENHFHVPVDADGVFTHRVPYGKALRAGALGSFKDLLFTATTHPAMGIYLNNAESTKAAPNENLGRELLELHTVGRDAYSEDDVKDSARILTGWRVDVWKTFAAKYSPDDHATGTVKVLKFKDANTSRDGRAVTRRYTDYLATHPATAERIARKLAVKFVRDDPPAALVKHLAKVYLKHDTEIVPVLHELVSSPVFSASRGTKVRDPGEDVVATWRALQVKARKPGSDSSGAEAILWQTSGLGQRPFAWSRPDGQPITNAAWASTGRMTGSWRMHYSMAGGWWPKDDLRYRPPKAWLPGTKVRFEDLVDHLSAEILSRPATAQLLSACCQAVGVRPGTRIDQEHAVVQWQMPLLLTTLLDSPAHMTR
ncbi:DUF1800 domain-containing protein [Nocardioides currus]|uniref:DUF1800 domain-containing protein n=1 Tax=Nocardioides currus TaxID=2133958 RepID=A0A2R7YS60_9ACTN|nr:DUF1800 domain-containing protein [Nocardioides currus]PUA79248.1 DUF1800 domain-containing protein [Nocardioides currus]